MGNGFIVIDERDWEDADDEQRAWMTFKTLKSIDGRLQKLEKKQWFDKACSFVGGVIGGFLAAMGVKIS